ncbi:MAG TPA: methionyl-tRNA formyltransferase [Syntrophomonadaceae bacterium]|nr:methionyl-tRNA formyltransferase [Syntrophomonadaceae bacterium]
MKILFCGTARFALPTLEQLIENRWELLGVVTQPDRPRGRGRKIASPPVKEYLSGSLPVYQPANPQELVDIINKYHLKPDVIVVVAYGMMLPLQILNLPQLGCINLHPSLLPRYRGAAPIQRAIMNGEQMSGITTMYLSKEMDAGDIILQEEIEIPEDATTGDMAISMAEQGAIIMDKTLTMIQQGTAPRNPQDHHNATYAPPLSREEEKIDWKCDAKEIYNQIRGMNPKPGAYTELKGRILKLWRSQVNEDEISGFLPGQVIESNPKAGFCVQTGNGQIFLTEVQPAGRARMSAADFLRGNKVSQGLSLG